MTEKINGQGFRPADTGGTRRADAAKPASADGGRRAAAAEQRASGDQVSLTPAGVALAKLQELVQSTPVVDSERVAELKDAIAKGSYEIDDQRVADRLLKFEREVLG